MSESAKESRLAELNPTQLIVISFAAASLAGGILLKLPFATNAGISFVDALFIATSAVCVTGLATVDVGTTFTDFGKLVILFLVQVGGLGITTYGAVFASVITGGLSLKNRAMVRDSFGNFGIKNFKILLFEILIFTLLFELAGALVIYMLMPDEGLFAAIFHSVAAFCNAGFAFYSDSFVGYRDNVGINAILMLLIFAGGIGFLVIREIRLRLIGRVAQISLHSRIVLAVSGALIVIGAVLILAFEWGGAFSQFTFKEKILASLFQSVTPRTAGFNTVDLSLLSAGTIFLLILLMFIGASPGSCGGGIKTSTLVVLITFVRNRSLGREDVFLFKRTIPREVVSKAVSVVTASSIVVILMTLLLVISEGGGVSFAAEPGIFVKSLFEITSAFATVGLTLGMTSELSTFGKLVVIFTMLIGRVGPLAIALAVGGEKPVRFKYAEERVMVG